MVETQAAAQADSPAADTDSVTISDAIRNDRRWQGPRLVLGCLGAVVLLAGLGIAAAVGPPAPSNAIGSIAAAAFGYGVIRYNRQGVQTYLPMWGLSGIGWFATLTRVIWVLSGVILIGASVSLAIEAVNAL